MSASKPEKPLVNLDDIMTKFSMSSPYYLVFILLILIINIHEIVTVNFVFAAEEVKYRCVDARFRNDSCAGLSNSTEVCAEWVYDDPHSFVAEFQLACQEWKRTLVGSANAFGYGIGLLLIGPLSDRMGRKFAMITTATINAIIGVAKSFSTNYWIYIILEFLGTAFGNSYSPAYILTIEMVAHEKRILTSLLCSVGLIIGDILLSLAAWLVPYWRHFLIVVYSPSIFFISYIFLLDESPRWLLSKGKKEKAIVILEKKAKSSKIKLDKNELDNLTYRKNEEATYMNTLKDTFTSKILMKRFFMCITWWIGVIFLLYGITIHSVSLPGSKYINFGLLAIAGLPSKLMTYWLLKKFTRKFSLIGTFFLSAVVCIAQSYVPDSLQWLSILLLMLGKLVVVSILNVTYIFTSELFPTYTRNTTHALCSAVGRIGSILAAQTPLLMVYWHGLPSLSFGAVAFLAGIVTLFAPDTTDEALPDTVRQAETFGDRQPANNGIDNNAMIHEIIELKTPMSSNKYVT